MANTSNPLVLITGGSGFIGSYCITKCLSEGHAVRATVRSLQRVPAVLEALNRGGAVHLDRLTFVEAELTNDKGWKEAADGATFVLHVASPFPLGVPKDENELIVPAREGTLRVLRAAKGAGVRRVVVTSSFAAVGYGHGDIERDFTEEDWTDPNGADVGAYTKSKTIAEKAAWDFMEKDGGDMELAVINPVGVYGPVISPDFSTSVQLVKRLLNGSMPACPDFALGVVDVRDVADLEYLAMTRPEAKGQRFLAISPPAMTILEMSLTLRESMGAAAKSAPTRRLPNFVVKFVSYFDTALAMLVPELGKRKNGSNEKAKTLLGWNPRTAADALTASGNSLVQLNLVRS